MPIDDFLSVTQPPPVGPEDLGVSPLPPAPVAPQMPQKPSGVMHTLLTALPGILGGAMGPGAGTGLLQGTVMGQQRIENEQQQNYALQQRDYELQRRVYDTQVQQQQMAARQRDQVLQQNLTALRASVKDAPDKAAYDSYVEAFGSGLQGMGFRVDANWLRKAVPYVAPQMDKKAWDVLQKWQTLPNNKQLLEKHPEQAANAMIPFDRDGDGIPEMVRLQDLSVLAGAPLAMSENGQVFSNPGTPLTVKANADGILQQLIEKAKAENKQVTPELIIDLQKQAIRAAAEAKPKEETGFGASGSDEDAAATAQAIAEGRQPPTLQGLYGGGRKVRAILEKTYKYDLAGAMLDWNATQQHLRTLNGAQQTRMRQAVDNASHSLDVIEELAKKWKGGRFPVLNRVNLSAAKNGVKGPEAQQIATQLEAQISDVTSELGNVYMGGNSPTDHALTLAAKNLSADWNEGQLLSALNLARTNLKIRTNSMNSVGVAGIGDPQYAPTPSAAPSAPETWERGPDGKLRKKGTP